LIGGGDVVLKIAVLPGDGIGPEVMEGAIAVLRAAGESCGCPPFSIEEFSAGAGEFLRNGNPLPEETLAACRSADAVLLGAMGLPDVRWSDGREMTPQIDLRERLDLYFGVRPIRLFHPADTPLKGYGTGEIDLVIVRENTEGLFSARNSSESFNADEARDVMRITRKASERLFHATFQLARKRRRLVTLVDKANVLPSMVFFREIFDEIAKEYPDVQTERVYVDAAALYLVQRPRHFDVLVTENMFGDILSDLAAGIIGGMGLAPSADIGEDCAVFQPSHGTAPDIAGQGIANPIAMVLSAALMLEWFDCRETVEAGARICQAVVTVLSDPARRTPDLGGRMTTPQVIDSLLESLS
jgi:3-isopropylmalate dehydrogenase